MNPDTLTGTAAAILFGLTLTGWITLDLRDRRHRRAETRTVILDLGPQLVNMVVAGECAHLWHDEEFHLCVRPFEHTGPHVCGVCEGPDAAVQLDGEGATR